MQPGANLIIEYVKISGRNVEFGSSEGYTVSSFLTPFFFFFNMSLRQ